MYNTFIIYFLFHKDCIKKYPFSAVYLSYVCFKSRIEIDAFNKTKVIVNEEMSAWMIYFLFFFCLSLTYVKNTVPFMTSTNLFLISLSTNIDIHVPQQIFHLKKRPHSRTFVNKLKSHTAFLFSFSHLASSFLVSFNHCISVRLTPLMKEVTNIPEIHNIS